MVSISHSLQRSALLRKITLFLLACVFLSTASAQMPQSPKREFRGAWIQAVNGQWQGLGRDRMRAELTRELNALQTAGINTILFQCRVEGDALYASQLEPWSRYLTGQQGTPPAPYWDPLEWMVQECHARGMEIHAWINPYRAKTKGTTMLATSHYVIQHPERCFTYGDLMLFDPGLPENRRYICTVAQDIVRRYDIDGFHIDDYFYPYPVAGQSIPDDASYSAYGQGLTRGDWRRQNVNAFIHELHEAIHAVKPWVKFGVSPFGIYRNEASWPGGSRTNGLQNYDDLYADVLLWVQKGWVDYNIPQIYWEIGHKAADYEELIRWWSRNCTERPLIIGQDVDRTIAATDPNNPNQHQMAAKMALQRGLSGISGSCQWYARAVADDKGQYATLLRSYYHSRPALQPLMPWIDKKAPRKVRKLKAVQMNDGSMHLCWTAPRAKKEMDKAQLYAVYVFPKGMPVDLNNMNQIVCVTPDTHILLPYTLGTTKWTYVVTALDRLHNESKEKKITVKL
ncbi:MAG: family 10 glycosylhydrolase [Bacteroidaceae bacterium]|nr:family 10 glycosylhydrolase [Bacteroidaceae bacterium]